MPYVYVNIDTSELNYKHLLAEKNSLERMIAEAKNPNSISIRSLEARLQDVIDEISHIDPSHLTKKDIMLRADLHNRFIGTGDLGELLHRLETFGLVDMLKLLAEKARLVDGEHIVLNAIKELESERA